MSNQAIINAIENRFIIQIEYKGEMRTIEPHAYGKNEKLRAYQTHPEEGWRLFEVNKITSINYKDRRFTDCRPLYNPDDKQMLEGFYARVIPTLNDPAQAQIVPVSGGMQKLVNADGSDFDFGQRKFVMVGTTKFFRSYADYVG